MTQGTALVIEATGIVGGNLCERLVADGWTVFDLSRRPERAPKGVERLAANLDDGQMVADVIKRIPMLPHLFYASWAPADTDADLGHDKKPQSGIPRLPVVNRHLSRSLPAT